MARVILGLGANLGDREENLGRALRGLGAVVDVERVSSLYESQPVGYMDQPWFLNAVCSGWTDLDPPALLAVAKKIERDMGREDGPRFGPRPIDVDILFYDDLILDTPTLQIPHPRLGERAFVLIPLGEIAPDLVHPVTGRTISRMLIDLGQHEEIRPLKRRWLDVAASGEETKR